jgi:PAS domain S-box-containing protein
VSNILVAVDQKENQRLLLQYLQRHYSVTVLGDTNNFNQPFDLGIFDGYALHRLWQQVKARKEAGQPLFFPILLITPRQDITMITRQLWQAIDEVIFTPIEKTELLVRVEVLLRARRLSVELEAKNSELHHQIVVQKEVEQALRESEERLRVSLLNAPLIVARNDLQLRYTWISNAQQGLSVESILGKRDDELAPRERVAALMTLKQQVLDNGVGDRQEVQVGWLGEYKLYDVTVEPVYDPHGEISGITTAALDITEYRRAEGKARELAALEERHRLARDLHDAVSQVLFSASMMTETLPQLWQNHPEKALEQIHSVHTMIRGASAEMRTLLRELRPESVIQSKLSTLLEQLLFAAQARKKISIGFMGGDIAEEFVLPPDVQVAFYRIAQESVNNVIKHGQAKDVKICLRQTPLCTAIIVKDDGQGFDSKLVQSGLGLGNMRERAESIGAAFDIKSQIGRGTRVRLAWTAPATASV